MIFCSHTIYSVLPIIILAIWNECAGLLFKVEPVFRNLVPDCKSCPVKCWEGLGKDSCASVSLQRLTVCKVTIIYHNIELYCIILFYSEKYVLFLSCFFFQFFCQSVEFQWKIRFYLASSEQHLLPFEENIYIYCVFKGKTAYVI